MPHALPLTWILLLQVLSDPSQINLVPRAELSETLRQWSFDAGAEGWIAEHQCTVSAEGGRLVVRALGDDPYLHVPVDLPGGLLELTLRVRARGAGRGSVYWTTDRSPQRGEDKVAPLAIDHDGAWHETSARFHAPGRIADLRIDPGTAPGTIEIDWIRLDRRRPNPLGIDAVEVAGRRVRFTVRNHTDEPQEFSAHGAAHAIDGGASMQLERPLVGRRPLEPVTLQLEVRGFPPLKRTVFVHNLEAEADWIRLPSPETPDPESPGPRPSLQEEAGAVSLCTTADGRLVRITRGGRLVAILGPLVHREGELPELKLVDRGPPLRFEGPGMKVTLALEGAEIEVSIHSDEPCEGPVVRALGPLEQGLFAGLEYLGRGERSSSKLDVETAEHWRFAPDPLKVTLPLMAVVTDRAAVALTWKDMQLQPVFAAPNFCDAAAEQRMALRGKQIEAVIRIDKVPLEEVILWAVKRRGLPPLPEPPRTPAEQRALCLAALNGPLRNDQGWGHCVEDRWPRRPFADMASSVFRLTGALPEVPQLVPGGAHVRNDASYFLSGRAGEWLEIRRQEVTAILKRQQPDGSFRYQGKYGRGHFEDTASGVCARPAATLLEYARLTGDAESLSAGVRTLQYMKRFRTPRGAQVWEIPLHTPDVLASAYLVWAYARGYELTGDQVYLHYARKWAASGIPFVYLWSRHPVMLYATVPVYGATNWKAPVWIGLPVQWCGGVYAYALTILDPHDDTLEWSHLARGILICGEQQQYPDGLHAGLLPDSFELAGQGRRPWDINPCALLSLRRVLDGAADGLGVAVAGGHRVVAPFPVTLRDGKAHVRGQRGIAYQILVDGRRIVDVASQGDDVVSVE